LRFAISGRENGAELYGHAVLATADLPSGVHREIRVTHGSGIAVNNYTLRLVETDTAVTGELLAFWPTSGAHVVLSGHPGCQKHFDVQDAWLAGLVAKDEERYRGCTPIKQAGVFEVCRARFAQEPNWGALMQQLDSLGAWTLPDPATLPSPGRISTHGVTVAVELRDRTTYRGYAYYAPYGQPWPEARRAAAINDLMLGVLRYPGMRKR
jgi:hypothetical protein